MLRMTEVKGETVEVVRQFAMQFVRKMLPTQTSKAREPVPIIIMKL
jgi:hypothetical protein